MAKKLLLFVLLLLDIRDTAGKVFSAVDSLLLNTDILESEIPLEAAISVLVFDSLNNVLVFEASILASISVLKYTTK